MRATSPSSAWACTRGASGAALPGVRRRRRPRGPGRRRPRLDRRAVRAGGETVRNGYPGYVAGATFAQALGWNGARGSPPATPPAPPAPRRSTPPAPASWPACATSPWWSGPTPRPRASSPPTPASAGTTPTGCGSACSARPTPAYFALYARRRMDLYGATDEDFAQVKVKNARHGLANPNARYRKEVTAEEVLASPMVADPLRLLEICATSDGGAAVVLARRWTSPAPHDRSPCGCGPSPTVTPHVPEHGHRDAELRHRLGRGRGARPTSTFQDSIAQAAYEEAGLGPRTCRWPRSTTCPPPLELDWYENIGLCKPGEAERLLQRRRHHPSAAGCRSTRAAGWPASARPSRPGARPGVRGRLAAAGPGRGPPGRGRPRSASPPTRACSATARRSVLTR